VSAELVRVLVLFAASSVVAMIALAFTVEDATLPPASKRRARRLFLEKLDAKQRWNWFLRRRFDAVSAGGRRYTISAYRPFNIHAGDAVFCVQVNGRIPVYDKLLAQKLLIEADEQLFLAQANIRTQAARWEPLIAAARSRYPGRRALVG
jgi:hypothetical protein